MSVVGAVALRVRVRLGALVACGLLLVVAGHPPGALASANANWTTGVEAGLPANASPTPSVALNAVSCSSAGNCAAVGRYFDSSGHAEGLLQSQTSGAWAAGIEAPLPANAGPSPATEIDSVSCASAGDCSAVGNYRDSSNNLRERCGPRALACGLPGCKRRCPPTPPRSRLSSLPRCRALRRATAAQSAVTWMARGAFRACC